MSRLPPIEELVLAMLDRLALYSCLAIGREAVFGNGYPCRRNDVGDRGETSASVSWGKRSDIIDHAGTNESRKSPGLRDRLSSLGIAHQWTSKVHGRDNPATRTQRSRMGHNQVTYVCYTFPDSSQHSAFGSCFSGLAGAAGGSERRLHATR